MVARAGAEHNLRGLLGAAQRGDHADIMVQQVFIIPVGNGHKGHIARIAGALEKSGGRVDCTGIKALALKAAVVRFILGDAVI